MGTSTRSKQGMVPRELQHRIFETLKKDPRKWSVIQQCEGDPLKTITAFDHAVIDWLHRGGTAEIAKRERQARTLTKALRVLDEYRDIVDQNLTVFNVGSASGVTSVIKQLADDLEERNPPGMKDRRDRSFYHDLGRQFRAAALPRPPVAVMRQLFKLVIDSIYAVDENHAPSDNEDDSNALKAFNAGYGKSASK